MKKFIFMLISMIVMSFSAMNAQEQMCQTISDGWFVSANIGTNAPIQHTFGFAESTWASEWRLTFGGEIGRNITPVTSLSLSDEMFVNVPIESPKFNTAFDKNTMYANVGFNLTNFFLGYNGSPRTLEVRVIPGIGWSHYFEPIVVNGVHKNFVTYRAMASFDWNLDKDKSWQINFKPAVTYFDRIHAHNCDVEFRVGMTYKFKGKHTNSHNIVLSDKTRTDAEYALLHDMLVKCQNTPPTVVEKVVDNTVLMVKDVPNMMSVYFEKGSYELSDNGKAVLNMIPKDTKVTVDAYASVDGEKDFNQTLSENRANAIAEYLKANGVTVETAVGHGVAKAEFDRVGIVVVTK